MRRSRRTASAILLATLLLAACARPTVPHLAAPSSRLSEAEIQERVDFIEERLDGSRTHAKWWNIGWHALNIGGGIIQGTVVAARTNNWDDRSAAIANIANGTLGMVYMYTSPMNSRFGADPVRELPDQTREERLAKLARAQEILEENAQRATAQIDWTNYAGSAAVAAISAGAVYAAGGGGRGQTVITGVGNLVGGTLMFLTQPAAPRRDIEDYVRRFVTPQAPKPRVRLDGTRGLGLGLRVDF